MIDNYEETMALIKKMEAHLPIPAQPTKRFIRVMRKDGIKVKSTQKIQIENVLYLSDDGGIGCEVGILHKGTVVITSLTHIRVKSSHPIGKEMRRYQNERINKLALQNIRRESL
jgi:hypothetical protein